VRAILPSRKDIEPNLRRRLRQPRVAANEGPSARLLLTPDERPRGLIRVERAQALLHSSSRPLRPLRPDEMR